MSGEHSHQDLDDQIADLADRMVMLAGRLVTHAALPHNDLSDEVAALDARLTAHTAQPHGDESPSDPDPPLDTGGLRREDCGPQPRTEPQPTPPYRAGVEIGPSTSWLTIRDAEPGTLLILTPGVYLWSKHNLSPGVDLLAMPGAYFQGERPLDETDREKVAYLTGAGTDLIDLDVRGYTARVKTGVVHLAQTAEDCSVWNLRSSGPPLGEAVHIGGHNNRLIGGVLEDAGTVAVSGGGVGHLIDGTTVRGGARLDYGFRPGHCGAFKFGKLFDAVLQYVEGHDIEGPLVWLDVGCENVDVGHGRGVGGGSAGLHFELSHGGLRGHHFDLRDYGRLYDGVSGNDPKRSGYNPEEPTHSWRNQRHQGATYLIHNCPARMDHNYAEINPLYGAGGCIWDGTKKDGTIRTFGDGTPATCEGASWDSNWLRVTGPPRGRGWLMRIQGIAPEKVYVGGNVYEVPHGYLNHQWFRVGKDYLTFAQWQSQIAPTDRMIEAAA